ncbi:hypothetical protein PORY_001931 [Pneumocystis oryctolagi]|uniref:Uncharacterized protein n=1 Tax=Pneumocystis oryctolagi TaxID=42067 RepID=A0ACB7CC80_9ASCO|nr:hypothetical protein PORY_001931 [Pneumocystis oryctolagi]
MNEFDINIQKKGIRRTYGKKKHLNNISENFKIWNDIKDSPSLKKGTRSVDSSAKNENISYSPSSIKSPKNYICSFMKRASFLYKISIKQNHENFPLIRFKKTFQDQENIMLDTFVSSDKNDILEIKKTAVVKSPKNTSNKSEHFTENKIKNSSSIIDSLLSFSSYSNILDFSDYISSLLSTYVISKLGEASFSEVYLMESKNGNEVVLKIIPFGKENQEKPQEVLHEIRITAKMSSINGFVKSKGFVIVKGPYPEHLISLWDKYDKNFKSENLRPDFYSEDQCFCILLLEKGGKDLEHVNIKTWKQVNRIFWDIVKVLSEGEKKYEFEHRDLHWGNILVNETPDSSEDMLSELSLYNTRFQQPCIIIIDYTFSRSRCSDHIGELTWNNLEDQEIFEGHGDYQYDIYRMMNDYVICFNKSWSEFIPRTNVFWLHYLIDKLIHYKGLVRPPTRLSRRINSINHADVEIERVFYERAESIWKAIDPKKKQSNGKKILEFNSAEDVLSWGIKEGLT